MLEYFPRDFALKINFLILYLLRQSFMNLFSATFRVFFNYRALFTYMALLAYGQNATTTSVCSPAQNNQLACWLLASLSTAQALVARA